MKKKRGMNQCTKCVGWRRRDRGEKAKAKAKAKAKTKSKNKKQKQKAKAKAKATDFFMMPEGKTLPFAAKS